jgi:hypothetical protein
VSKQREVRYYHGGVLGLTEILPAIRTGAQTSAGYYVAELLAGRAAANGPLFIHQAAMALLCHDPARVYVTRDALVARGYAAGAARGHYGAVYEVRPCGELIRDKLLSYTWSCDSAAVIRGFDTVAASEQDALGRATMRKYPPAAIQLSEADWETIAYRLSEEMLRIGGKSAMADMLRQQGVKVLDPTVAESLLGGAAGVRGKPDYRV